MDMVRIMMAHAISLIVSGDALLTTTYILNRLHSKSVQTTLYELTTDTKSELAHL